MVFTPKQLALSSLFTLLLSHPVSSQRCTLVRDVDTCKALTWADEYRCLMQANSLRAIMDCVEIKEQPGVDLEYTICRPPDNGVNDDIEQYYFSDSAKKGQICTKPRTILIKGPQTMPDGWKLGIIGALEACPEKDPDFHNCLCMQNVGLPMMNQLAQYFKQVKNQDLSCKTLPRRSTSFLDELAETPHLHQARDNATDFHTHAIHPRALSEFNIDAYGRPVYADKRGTGYPLPFYDQYISNQAARRCYIHPEVPVEASCRTWRLATPVTSALNVRPIKAVYSKAFTPVGPVSTYSAQPDTTAVPSEQLAQVKASVGGSSSSGSAPTPAPTGTTQTGSAGQVKGQVLLQLSAIIVAVTFVIM